MGCLENLFGLARAMQVWGVDGGLGVFLGRAKGSLLGVGRFELEGSLHPPKQTPLLYEQMGVYYKPWCVRVCLLLGNVIIHWCIL